MPVTALSFLICYRVGILSSEYIPVIVIIMSKAIVSKAIIMASAGVSRPVHV